MNNKSCSGEPVAPAKKWAFRVILLLFPLLLIAVAEISIRLFLAAPTADDPFLNIGAIPDFFEKVSIDGVPHYRVSHAQAYRGRSIAFPVVKPEGTIRVFCLGGSASAGWPHPVSEIYSSFLQRALERAYPGRSFEVINASAHAYASYRVRMIFNNVINFDPDLIIIYSGNNEFLEKRTYHTGKETFDQVSRSSRNLRVVRLLEYKIKRLLNPESSLSGISREHINFEMWTKIAREALTLRQDPEQYEQLRKHFHYNISRMVETAAEKNIPVVLLTVPVNLRDWHPNVSLNRLEGDALTAWRDLYYAGRRGLLQGDYAAAEIAFKQALALEPMHAEVTFYLARTFEKQERFAEAIEAFIKAKDLDHNPFRAMSDFNVSINQIADEFPNAHLADTFGAFMKASDPYAPGFNLLLDYVHPHKDGNLLIAKSVFNTIVQNQLFGEATSSEFIHVPPDLPPGEFPYVAETDYQMQETLVHLFAMMHQYENMVWKAKQFDGPGFPELPRIKRALAIIPDVLEMERKHIMGEPVNPADEAAIKERLKAYYYEEFPKLKWVDDLNF